MRRKLPRFGHAVSACLAAAALSACTVGPSPAPDVLSVDDDRPTPIATRNAPVPLPPLGPAGHEEINWQDCRSDMSAKIGAKSLVKGLNYDCGSIFSTPDRNPDPEASVELSVARISSHPGAVPLVVVNDVNGEPGTAAAARLAKAMPERLLERYEIIGFDRRGTGDSEPVDCIKPRQRQGILDTTADAAHIDALLDAVRDAGMDCAVTLKSKQDFYNAEMSASDVDQLRTHLGVPKLHAIGRGEGSRVLTTYAAQYHDSVGRFVLDGIPDPAPQVEAVYNGIAAGAESTWDAFAADCATRKCPLGKKPAATLNRLLKRLAAKPARTADAVRVGPTLALNAVWNGLADPDRWPELARAIAAKKPDGLAAFLTPDRTRSRQGDPMRAIDGILATTCNDQPARLSPDKLRQLSDTWSKAHPIFGGLTAQRLAWCSKWPVPSEQAPSPSTSGLPPELVVSTAADPTTPGAGTDRAVSQMDSARPISWQGAGHGAAGRSDCIDERLTRFLAEGNVPSGNVTCPA